jgi:putative transposase
MLLYRHTGSIWFAEPIGLVGAVKHKRRERLAVVVQSMSNPFRYFNSSPEVIRLVVMMYVRYPRSLRNVEDLLAERGINISHETIRFWWNRFGPMFAAEIRKRRVAHMRAYLQSRWHLDEVFVKVNGKLCYLWRAGDHEGEVLEAGVTAKRDKAGAVKLLKRIMKKYGRPQTIVTDRLRAYPVVMQEIGAADRHEVGKRLNNRAENSHQQFRRRERAMQRFRSMKTLLKFSSVHSQVYNQLNQERHLVTRQVYKQRRSIALMEWRALQGKASLASGRVALCVGGCSYSDHAFSTARGREKMASPNSGRPMWTGGWR